MNRVVLVGRITADPELKTSASNVPYVQFTIAVNRLATSNGERQADFISCVVFNRQAENLCRFIKKGGLIGVDGKIQTSRYQAQDGTSRNRTDVVCDIINFLESRNANNGSSDYQYQNNDTTYNPNGYNQPNNQGLNQPNSYSRYNQQGNQRPNNYSGYNQQVNQPVNQQVSQPVNPNNFNQSFVQPKPNYTQPVIQPKQENTNLNQDAPTEVKNSYEITDDDLPF